jgi:hypothetical protein
MTKNDTVECLFCSGNVELISGISKIRTMQKSVFCFGIPGRRRTSSSSKTATPQLEPRRLPTLIDAAEIRRL